MSRHSYILAHDLGTTGNKASLFDEQGHPVASAFASYETAYPCPGWAEQDARDWWRAVRDSTRTLLASSTVAPGDVAVVCFSGMMNGALAVDAAGAPLRTAIIWADQRATAEEKLLAQRCGMEQLYRRTGHRASASYTAAKVLWIQRHQPDLYACTHQVLQAKDYAAYKMSGVFATDYSDASSTNLFDLARRTWAVDIIEAVGLDPRILPPVYPSSTVIGQVTAQAAAETGLLAGTPVVIGGGDGACATVGAGSVDPGDAYNYVGSSSWIAVTAAEPLYDPQMRTFTFAHLDPRLYFPTGSMQSAGGAYDWFERLLRGAGEARLYDEMGAAAATVEPGARGLLFLPYLIGERSPHWNPLARGAFVGLTMAHGRAEMARAVLEGVAFNLKSILDAFLEQGAPIQAMRLIGGGARSALWRQILADVYGLPILRPALVTEATSLGAAIAGGVGVGLFPDFRVARTIVAVEEAERPDPAHTERYAALYDLFRRTYTALEPIFNQLEDHL
ncbi:MAG TPA: xylulokinase [Anaerolineae bacterium]|nr:xylulokinase [Anaerolineae bacterium]